MSCVVQLRSKIRNAFAQRKSEQKERQKIVASHISKHFSIFEHYFQGGCVQMVLAGLAIKMWKIRRFRVITPIVDIVM